MCSYFGIDTSNYTTSAAVYYKGGLVKKTSKLLSLKAGSVGLRQSEVVFQHVNKLPEVINDAIGIKANLPKAIGVSSRPRDQIGSYMPCFNVGVSTAKSISCALKIPYYEFSHQAGHIVAALYSVGRLDLLKKSFFAFHVSGGTTEALLVEPCDETVIKTQIVGKTLDLTAGQLIDRVGSTLSLSFPAGRDLELLAKKCEEDFKIVPCIKETNCCLSGVQNLCEKMRKEKKSKEQISKFCIDYIRFTLDKMCFNILNKYGQRPLLFAGGVMANSMIREYMLKKYDAIFAKPDFSSDNAAGIAVLTAIKEGAI